MALAPDALAVPPLDKRKRVPLRAIRALVKHIAEQFDPDEIILFGSHAYGKPAPWSDVDLLVVKDIPEGTEIESAIAVSKALPSHNFHVDILVRSRAVIEQRKAWGDWFLREITTKGKSMYRRGDSLDRNRRRSATYRVERSEATRLKETPSSPPNPLTEEWVGIAEADLETARLVMREIRTPIARGACFHAQQCAEKYLKAYLTEKQIEFPRTHLLSELLELCLPEDAEFMNLKNDLAELEDYAVAVRYPGSRATVEQAEAALAAATRVRAFVRGKLNLA